MMPFVDRDKKRSCELVVEISKMLNFETIEDVYEALVMLLAGLCESVDYPLALAVGHLVDAREVPGCGRMFTVRRARVGAG